jgi:hypothetical protein
MQHAASGLTALHIDSAADAHNHFSLAFRTPVLSSTGAPHVLEHTVLCGSERFPVKDPFHAMTKRSLQTEMNAVTAADHTTYYFSTCHWQDYENLLDVFLDATFFPSLREGSFRQEGHRIEPTDLQAPLSSPLALKGVVYNEMQGYYATSGEQMSRALYSSLLPGTPYAFNHGGDPRELPLLTHSELQSFHRQHYAPDNALLCSYGSGVQVQRLLALVEAKALQPLLQRRGGGGGGRHTPPRAAQLPLAAGPAAGSGSLQRVDIPMDGGDLVRSC